MTISSGRTEQLYIFFCVTGFTSDFLSFIDVELIRFFDRAIQLITQETVKKNQDRQSHVQSPFTTSVQEILTTPESTRGPSTN